MNHFLGTAGLTSGRSAHIMQTVHLGEWIDSGRHALEEAAGGFVPSIGLMLYDRIALTLCSMVELTLAAGNVQRVLPCADVSA